MHRAISARLSVMMFLQFFIWGAWYVTAYIFLNKIGFGGGEIKWTYSVGPIAGIISPLLVGMIADRFFSTERILGFLHLVGAGAMFLAARLMQGTEPSALHINLLLFGHMLCYFPTLALVNTLAMHTMTNSEKQFPLIRVFGTIGWIAAGLVVSWRGWDGAIEMFYLSAGAGLLMGIYSFTLPHTPPPAAGKEVSIRQLFGIDALVLLKQPSYFTFILSSFLICIPLSFYYQMAGKFVDHAGLANPAFKMSFGQMSEIFFMLVMPLFFARLGVKWMLAVGMLAWVVRYALFALGASDGVVWRILVAILLHGICYDFFFVTGQIYTDRVAPAAIRGQAQGMLVLFTLGFGMLIGAQVAGEVEKRFTPANNAELSKQADVLGGQMKKVQGELDGLYGLADASWLKRTMHSIAPASLPADKKATGDQLTAQLEKLSKERSQLLLKSVEWKPIWTIPAVGAAVVLVLFVLLFRDTTKSAVTEGAVAAAAAREEMA